MTGAAVLPILPPVRRALTVLSVGAWTVAGLLASASAGGCAMCRSYVSSDADPMAKGLDTGILFLMAMPFLLAGAIGGGVYLSRRQSA